MHPFVKRMAVLACLSAGIAVSSVPASAQMLVNTLVIPAELHDLNPGMGANVNRLGGFFSDLYYDRNQNVYYGLPDRGPGGGLISYNDRVQTFGLDVDPTTGAVSNLHLQKTTLLKEGAANFNGLNPGLLNGDKRILGRSLDAEGFVLARHGNYYIADEYGPSVYEFTPQGQLVRKFTPPANIVPRDASGLNFVDGRPTITSGRQDNRGFEGLTSSPDGSKLYAVMQDPLVNEGSSSDGRRSRNLRIVVYDTATGDSTAQYIYQLESIADINARVTQDFSATNQGRSIGLSAIIALNDHEFLVIERDNRGIGVENPTNSNPDLNDVGSKRIYKIDISGATDVSATSLAGTNNLPAGVNPVTKTLLIDVQAELIAAGLTIPEKMEGITVGPQLADGDYLLLLGTDNDFSVTQTGSGEQFNVYSDGTQGPIDGDPMGRTLLPTYLYAFKVSLPGYVAPQVVPEPSALALFGLGTLGVAGFFLRRRKG